jgi:hypothetical protein
MKNAQESLEDYLGKAEFAEIMDGAEAWFRRAGLSSLEMGSIDQSRLIAILKNRFPKEQW